MARRRGMRSRCRRCCSSTRGRKSGTTFTVPLVYIHDRDDVIVVASKGGASITRSGTATWSPIPTCTSRSARAAGGARRARQGAEQERLWPRLVDAYADFDTYQSWTEREIPVFVLETALAAATAAGSPGWPGWSRSPCRSARGVEQRSRAGRDAVVAGVRQTRRARCRALGEPTQRQRVVGVDVVATRSVP